MDGSNDARKIIPAVGIERRILPFLPLLRGKMMASTKGLV
jgi:hypothetical protein